MKRDARPEQVEVDRAERVWKGSAAVETTIVIPVHNAEPYLADQLRALAGQEDDAPWQVVVVDDASTDGSVAVADSFSEQLDLTVLRGAVRRGPAHARNTGAAHGSGDKLLFLDADDEVAPGYVAAMSSALDNAGLVAARLDQESLNAPWVRGAFGPPGQTRDVDVALGFLPAASGGSIGVERAVFEAVGGFEESLRWADDIAFCWDVQLAGTPLVFVPDAVVRYRYRHRLRDLFQQSRAHGSDLPLLYRRYRSSGLRRRVAVGAWPSALAALARARDKADLAKATVQLGYRFGTLEGSIRHRVLYL